MRFRTRSVHTGVDKDSAYRAVSTPIYQTSIFRFESPEEPPQYDYTRSGNPTRQALAESLAALEGGAGAACCATGIAAETRVLTTLAAGDHIIAPDDLYGGTHRLMTKVLQERWKLDVDFVRMTDLDAVRGALRPETRLLWIETPSNPLLRIFDIPALVEIAAANGLRTVVDNTFASPYFQRPLELGCDLVVHSTTKYLNGHSDVIGGAVVARTPELLEEIEYQNNALGLAQAPFDSWLVLRGVKTLALRMKAHEAGAFAIARYLKAHCRVRKVWFPGFEDHPGHDVAKRQMSGFPGMLSFEAESEDLARQAATSTKLFKLTESLGGTASLIELPSLMSHASMDEDARLACGIVPELVRLSIGLEDPEDLLDDLERALAE